MDVSEPVRKCCKAGFFKAHSIEELMAGAFQNCVTDQFVVPNIVCHREFYGDRAMRRIEINGAVFESIVAREASQR